MQEVLSNDCAEPTQESLRILRGMHPAERGTALQGPARSQVKITPKHAQCRFFVLAGNAHSPADCFGWSECLLYSLRGKKKLGRCYIPFIHQVARLVARIAARRCRPSLRTSTLAATSLRCTS
jgi:hypothetical protein